MARLKIGRETLIEWTILLKFFIFKIKKESELFVGSKRKEKINEGMREIDPFRKKITILYANCRRLFGSR